MNADASADPSGALTTLQDLLRHGISRLLGGGAYFGHGFPDARSEAAYLLCWGLPLPHDLLEEFLQARVTSAEKARLLDLFERRARDRIPSAYLTKEAWLGDHRFHVDERVLIPRSFIAELLRDGLSPWIGDVQDVRRVLDLCTGSGCLAILAAEAFGEARIDAADISPGALEVAARNVSSYGLEERIRLVHSDLFGTLEGQRYDVILCNPPYVTAASMGRLPDEYRHEPELALAAGADGLDAIRGILAAAPEHLNERGMLVMEIGHNRATVEAAWPQLPITWLETSGGDELVCLLTREQMLASR